jgi:hypothetical protein
VSHATEMLGMVDRHLDANAKIGLTADQVRAVAAKYRAVPVPEMVKTFDPLQAMARAWRKSSHGGARIPDYVVNAMVQDYTRLGSTRKVAALYNRDFTTIMYIFRTRGIPLKGRGGPNNRRKAR